MNPDGFEDRYTELVAPYALGSLNQFDARAFCEHLEEGCEKCEADLKEYESVVEVLSLQAAPVSPRDSIRQQLLDRIANETSNQQGSTTAPVDPGFITIREHDGRWRESEPGVRVKFLFSDPENGSVTTLVKLAPGSQLPTHSHNGIEQCYVIAGDVDGGEMVLGPGDFHVALQRSIHPNLKSHGGATLLLVSPAHYDVIA